MDIRSNSSVEVILDNTIQVYITLKILNFPANTKTTSIWTQGNKMNENKLNNVIKLDKKEVEP